MKEIWKPLKYNDEFIQFHEISNFGRVRSIDHTIESYNRFGSYTRHVYGKLRKQRTNNIEPYLFFDYNRIENNTKKTQSIYIHKAVYESFIGSTEGKYVSHRNGNTFDNNVTNLFLISHSELQVRNMQTHPEARWRLAKINKQNGFEWLRRDVNNHVIRAIRNLSTEKNPKEIADILGISLSTVYKYRRQ